MIEATFDVTSLGENLMYFNGKAKFAQIYNLICMKKNTDILNPNKGVDINSYYYAFNDARVLADLEREITDQIELYTPYRPLSVNCGSKWVGDRYVISIVMYLRDQEETVVVVADGVHSDFDVFMRTAS